MRLTVIPITPTDTIARLTTANGTHVRLRGTPAWILDQLQHALASPLRPCEGEGWPLPTRTP